MLLAQKQATGHPPSTDRAKKKPFPARNGRAPAAGVCGTAASKFLLKSREDRGFLGGFYGQHSNLKLPAVMERPFRAKSSRKAALWSLNLLKIQFLNSYFWLAKNQKNRCYNCCLSHSAIAVLKVSNPLSWSPPRWPGYPPFSIPQHLLSMFSPPITRYTTARSALASQASARSAPKPGASGTCTVPPGP
jgi:hypothetical protein